MLYIWIKFLLNSNHIIMKFFVFLFLSISQCDPPAALSEKPVNFIQASSDFVEALSKGENVENFIKVFQYADLDQLCKQTGEDKQKITFWGNIYNGYILHILRQNPALYKDRNSFFKRKQIQIGQKKWSFEDIEHGILRGSRHPYFFGYMKKWFPSKTEKKLRVAKTDYRIHFVLNCGARSCPPVLVLQIDSLGEQLEKATRDFLMLNSRLEQDKNIVFISPLFSWFRGDFGGEKGIKKILIKHNIITSSSVRIKYTEYDWTLDLNNFTR